MLSIETISRDISVAFIFMMLLCCDNYISYKEHCPRIPVMSLIGGSGAGKEARRDNLSIQCRKDVHQICLNSMIYGMGGSCGIGRNKVIMKLNRILH